MEELSGRRRFSPGLYSTVSFVTSSRGTGAPTGISVYEIIIIYKSFFVKVSLYRVLLEYRSVRRSRLSLAKLH